MKAPWRLLPLASSPSLRPRLPPPAAPTVGSGRRALRPSPAPQVPPWLSPRPCAPCSRAFCSCTKWNHGAAQLASPPDAASTDAVGAATASSCSCTHALLPHSCHPTCSAWLLLMRLGLQPPLLLCGSSGPPWRLCASLSLSSCALLPRPTLDPAPRGSSPAWPCAQLPPSSLVLDLAEVAFEDFISFCCFCFWRGWRSNFRV